MTALSTGEDSLKVLIEISRQAKQQGRLVLAHLVEMAALELSNELKEKFLLQQQTTSDTGDARREARTA